MKLNNEKNIYKIYILILLAISIDGVTITSNFYLKIPNSKLSGEFTSNLVY